MIHNNVIIKLKSQFSNIFLFFAFSYTLLRCICTCGGINGKWIERCFPFSLPMKVSLLYQILLYFPHYPFFFYFKHLYHFHMQFEKQNSGLNIHIHFAVLFVVWNEILLNFIIWLKIKFSNCTINLRQYQSTVNSVLKHTSFALSLCSRCCVQFLTCLSTRGFLSDTHNDSLWTHTNNACIVD